MGEIGVDDPSFQVFFGDAPLLAARRVPFAQRPFRRGAGKGRRKRPSLFVVNTLLPSLEKTTRQRAGSVSAEGVQFLGLFKVPDVDGVVGRPGGGEELAVVGEGDPRRRRRGALELVRRPCRPETPQTRTTPSPDEAVRNRPSPENRSFGGDVGLARRPAKLFAVGGTQEAEASSRPSWAPRTRRRPATGLRP